MEEIQLEKTKTSSKKLEKNVLLFVAFVLTVAIMVVIGRAVDAKNETDLQWFNDAKSRITEVQSLEFEKVKKVCKNATEATGINVKDCFMEIHMLGGQLCINYNVLTNKNEYVIYAVVSKMLGQKLAIYLRDGQQSSLEPRDILEIKSYIDGLERMDTINVSKGIIYLD